MPRLAKGSRRKRPPRFIFLSLAPDAQGLRRCAQTMFHLSNLGTSSSPATPPPFPLGGANQSSAQQVYRHGSPKWFTKPRRS